MVGSAHVPRAPTQETCDRLAVAMTAPRFDPAWLSLLSAVLLGGAFLISAFRPRWPLWVRVAWRAATFAALTWLVQRTVGSPLHPTFDGDAVGRQVWGQFLEVVWWLTGAWVAVGASRLLVVLEQQPRHIKIASDLVAGAIYVATVLAVVNFAFSVPVAGLLATSGVIAIVLGLALQSTLSDMFSGIAIGLERPYDIGDIIWIEGGIEGRVMQITWRSTLVVTGHNNVAIVPNSVMAKARLVNRSAPTSLRGDTVEVRLDARAPVAECLETLTAAVQACCPCAGPPAPSVSCIGVHGDGAIYEIAYTVTSSDQLSAARSALFAQVQRHLKHSGISLAATGRIVQRQLLAPTGRELLGETSVFGILEPTQLDALAGQLRAIRLQAGDVLSHDGDAPERIIVLASGTVEVTSGELTSRSLERLGPGEVLCVWEILTGALLEGTVTALTSVKAYAIERMVFEAAVATVPDLVPRLCLLARRDRNDHLPVRSTVPGAAAGTTETFLTRLQKLAHWNASSGQGRIDQARVTRRLHV